MLRMYEELQQIALRIHASIRGPKMAHGGGPPIPEPPIQVLYDSRSWWLDGAEDFFKDFDPEGVEGRAINLGADGWTAIPSGAQRTVDLRDLTTEGE